jgi:hypothetical protein
MLTIRDQQMRALAAARMTDFTRRMISHLTSAFPEWSRDLGPGELAAFVRHGVERAARYGFATELDVARYLHIMQALGDRFDESPGYRWAASLLSQNIPASDKMSRLRDAADYEIEARRIRRAD